MGSGLKIQKKNLNKEYKYKRDLALGLLRVIF
jgi:hypothetical protein